MKKSIQQLIATILLVALLAGCSGDIESEYADFEPAFAEITTESAGDVRDAQDDENNEYQPAIRMSKGYGASLAAVTLDNTVTPHDYITPSMLTPADVKAAR